MKIYVYIYIKKLLCVFFFDWYEIVVLSRNGGCYNHKSRNAVFSNQRKLHAPPERCNLLYLLHMHCTCQPIFTWTLTLVLCIWFSVTSGSSTPNYFKLVELSFILTNQAPKLFSDITRSLHLGNENKLLSQFLKIPNLKG